MTFKERFKQTSSRQWFWFIVWAILTVLFSIWSNSAWVLLFILLFLDIYITKLIPWGFWKNSKNNTFRKTMEWVDAIVFALIAVYFINTFFFQNYQIPTSSLEKSLLVGDFLAVSKLSYGPRAPITPLSFPLAQHTMPVTGGKSYFEKPQWKYNRLKGFRKIKRNDIVVFNFPVGDTVAVNQQGIDFYLLSKLNPAGSEGVRSDKRTYGEIVYRPVDRRENYVKRCIGLPGETIALKDDSLFIDGNYISNPRFSQHNYMIHTDGAEISPDVFSDLGINIADYNTQNSYGQTVTRSQDLTGVDSLSLSMYNLKPRNGNNGRIYFSIPLTNEMIEILSQKTFVWDIIKERETAGIQLLFST